MRTEPRIHNRRTCADIFVDVSMCLVIGVIVVALFKLLVG